MVEMLPPRAETAQAPASADPRGTVEALAAVLTDDAFRTVRELLLVASWLTEEERRSS